MTLISATEEQKQKAPKEEKAHPWAPPPQHNFLKNWQRHVALRKRQQEALSGELSGWGLPGLIRHLGSAAVRFLSSTCPEPRFRLSMFVPFTSHFSLSVGREISPMMGLSSAECCAPVCSDLPEGLHSWLPL